MKGSKNKGAPATPVRRALLAGSTLQSQVRNGTLALKAEHRALIDSPLRSEFADSLDLDAALHSAYPQEHRWDYLLGHAASATVVAVEPHSAKQDEISVVIAKRSSAKQQLAAHLKPGAKVTAWLWVSSGKVHFADTERARRRLDQRGIEFVGTRVMEKHVSRRAAGSGE